MHRRSLGPIWPLLALALAGCGMEAVDTRMQARSESGIQDHELMVAQGKWVCANLVPVDNSKFNIKEVARGEITNVFGPFVPCNTPVDPGSEKACKNCGQAFRTSGEFQPGEEKPTGKVDSKQIAVLAAPRLECPHCKELIDPGALMIRAGKEGGSPKDATLGPNNCPKCKRYFTTVAKDLVNAIDVHEEVHCPSCKKAIDPLNNRCTNSSCKLVQDGYAVRNVKDFEGPCWRCGGVSICPYCNGSGQGSTDIPAQYNPPGMCWYCTPKDKDVGTGRCPECDQSGFARYEGSLPPKFAAFTKGQEPKVKPEATRGWQHKRKGGEGGKAKGKAKQ